MIVERIDCAGLIGATPAGGWDHELEPEDCVHTLIVIVTDTGLVGVGSAFTSDALTAAALRVLEPLLLGESALEPERVTEKLHQNTFWLGRGGTLTHVISGIDIALWDVFGKAVGQPVGRLLGGRYRDRVQPYASLLMDEPSLLTKELEPLVADGYRAFKIGWGPFGRVDAATDERIVRAARDAVGPASRLMVDAGGSDAHWSNGYKWALRTASMLADYDVEWFEEPLVPDAIDDFVTLREHSPVPIAGGETLTRRQSFLPWLSRRAFDVVQPDVTKVGGISDQRRIARTAEDHGVKYVGHGWNTAAGVAADLQLASAFSGTDLVEYITGSPYVDDLAGQQFRLDADGMLAISDAPGLGFELDGDAVRHWTAGKLVVPS